MLPVQSHENFILAKQELLNGISIFSRFLFQITSGEGHTIMYTLIVSKGYGE